MESLHVEDINIIEQPELIPVLKDIVALHAVVGCPPKRRRRRRTSILAKATGTHNGTKMPSVLLYKTACREKVYYRGRRGMWWGYNTTGVGGGWDGVVGYESGLMGYAVQCVRYCRCIVKIKEKKEKKISKNPEKKRKKGKKKKKKGKKTHGCINKPWALVKWEVETGG